MDLFSVAPLKTRFDANLSLVPPMTAIKRLRSDEDASTLDAKKPKTCNLAEDVFYLFDKITNKLDRSNLEEEITLSHFSLYLSRCNTRGLTEVADLLLEPPPDPSPTDVKKLVYAGLVSDEGSLRVCRSLRQQALLHGEENHFLDLCDLLGDRTDAAGIALSHMSELLVTLRDDFPCDEMVYNVLLFGHSGWCIHTIPTEYHLEVIYRKSKRFDIFKRASSLSKKLLGGNVALISALVCDGALSLRKLKDLVFADTLHHTRLENSDLLRVLLKECSDVHARRFACYKLLFSKEIGLLESEFLSRFYVSALVDMNPCRSSDADAVTSVVSSLLLAFACRGRTLQ